MNSRRLPVLIINGTIGAGKSTIGLAIHEVLSGASIPHAFLDLDHLTYSYPKKGRFNRETLFESLSVLWPIYKKAGATRLVLSRVVEKPSDLEPYEQALGPCSFIVVRLKVSEEKRTKRITQREQGNSLRWCLERTVELEGILEESALDFIEVENEGQAPIAVAKEILNRVGWDS